VARFDPEWAKKWGPMVEILIREVASPDRDDKLFAFSRCFDRFEGHGWASGDSGFGRGNNNESSSESMNCWYGIAMWGASTGNDVMRDYGLYMYTTDMTTIEEYWFDVSDTNFPKGYTRECVGMVWGDGGFWGTWFSGDADCIHGIQYLPFTPGSMYLARYPDYVDRAYNSLMKVRNAKENLNAGWGDLVVMFGAGANPSRSAEFVDSTPQMKVEDGNTRAMMYHYVHTLNTFGKIDRTVTGDYPIYNVYNKDGKKTYVVYNYTGKPLTVKFSDGKSVDASKKGMTVAN
jgi:endoglucanase Acf2